MIARRFGHTPSGGFGMLALEILEDHACELDVFGLPLGFGEDDPIERALQASFESLREKGLGMAHESDFSSAKAELFPYQTHQAVSICAAACIAMPAGGENEANVLRRSRVRRDSAGDLIGEGLDHQRMRWVEIVVMEHDVLMRTPSFTDGLSQRFTLQQTEVQSGREYENVPGVAAANCGG